MANNLETELGITNRQMGTMSTKITNLVNSLTALQTSLRGTSNSLRKFTDTMNGLNTSGLQSVFDVLKNIGSLYKMFDKLNGVDLNNVSQVFTTLNQQIIPFITTLKDASKELESLATIFSKFKSVNTSVNSTAKSIRKIKDNSDKASKSADVLEKKLNKAFNWGNLYLYYNLSKRYVKTIYDAGIKAMDFTETLNLFQSTFKDLTNEAYKFNVTLQNAFGTNIEETMRYQSKFNAMIYSLSKVSDVAYLASKNLVQMGIDASSLLNVSTETAMSKLLSGLAGQTKAVRTLNMDITEQTLIQEAQRIGLQRTVRQMNQAEKQILRIIAMQNQLKNMNAVGDFSATIKDVKLVA